MKLILLGFLYTSLIAKKPELFLLNNYTKDTNVTSWYMSEKLDGVRAYWDGKHLISRNGNVFNPPKYFTKDFPKHELDGELWSKRGDFSNVSSIVNTESADERWKELTYNVFEVPNSKGNLIQRLESLHVNSQYIKIIEQIRVKNTLHVDSLLKTIESKNGEGVVVRDGSLDYYTGRENTALKVKSYVDEECKVVGHNNGKGKNKSRLGSLSCRTLNGLTIKIGSGLKDKQRDNPPKIGAIITFKYYGLTSKGKPRFPVFLRIRKDLE
ncbi:DNA ligase [Sulfurimonas sp.]|nr:DNA ligase [Sulfurimonas sp.]